MQHRDGKKGIIFLVDEGKTFFFKAAWTHCLVWLAVALLALTSGCRAEPAPVGAETTRAANKTAAAVKQISRTAVQPSATQSKAVPSLTLSPTPRPAATVTRTPAPSLTATAAEGQPLVIGFSEGGLPLEVYRFGSGGAHRMFVAGIHGGYEYNTVALADQLIAYLREHPTLVPQDKTLYILRVLNPDGLTVGKGPEGRANASGVDLNRNWDAFWQSDWQKAGCWDKSKISAGAQPGSEPETRALAKFIEGNQIEALISYHSAGLGIFAGGQPPSAGSKKLAVSLSGVSGYTYPPAPSTCVYTGQLIDWASARGIAAVDVELNNHAETDFAINLRVLKVFLSWRK